MTPLDNRLLGQVAQGLAADGRSLDALRREAQRDPHGAVKKAAQQFEALFMQMALKSMRDALPRSGMLDSTAQQMYTGMLDAQLATRVAAGGTGLAEMIARQLTRHMQAPVASPPPTDRRAEAARPDPKGAVRYAELAASDADASAPHADLRPVGAQTASRTTPAVDASSGTAADPMQRSFVLRHWDHALEAQRRTGIPARFILGQAALESGWGRHEIRDAAGRASHNLFGIKAGPNWRGRTVEVLTSEYENGVEKKVVERFRAYDSYGEAFRDWARLMTSNPRYAHVLRAGRDARGFAEGLQHAGYATDPQYGARLARVIETAGALKGRA